MEEHPTVERLRAVTFNILHGGQTRFPRILQVIDGLKPDLLVLQECQDWDQTTRLEETAEVMGLPCEAAHAVLGRARPRGSGSHYHVAMLSRRPMERVQVYNNPHLVGHCLVVARVPTAQGPLCVYGTHFDAHHERLRFVEARHLRSILPDDFPNGLHLLMGDLNSLSHRDPYPPTLAYQLEASGTLKYGLPPRIEVIPDLEAFGWRDALYIQGKPERWVSATRHRGGVTIDYRLDYQLVSPALGARLERAEIVDTGDVSDHLPMLAEYAL